TMSRALSSKPSKANRRTRADCRYAKCKPGLFQDRAFFMLSFKIRAGVFFRPSSIPRPLYSQAHPEDVMRGAHWEQIIRFHTRLRPYLARPRMARLAGMAMLLLFAGSMAADEPEPLYTLAQSAIKDARIEKTGVLGVDNARRRFTELPAEGGLLIG